MSYIIINTPFQIALKFCIDYNQIRYIRNIPILTKALLKMVRYVIMF